MASTVTSPLNTFWKFVCRPTETGWGYWAGGGRPPGHRSRQLWYGWGVTLFVFLLSSSSSASSSPGSALRPYPPPTSPPLRVLRGVSELKHVNKHSLDHCIERHTHARCTGGNRAGLGQCWPQFLTTLCLRQKDTNQHVSDITNLLIIGITIGQNTPKWLVSWQSMPKKHLKHTAAAQDDQSRRIML